MEKVGLLGGTFDPVHVGHLQLAKAAIAEIDLDRVLLIPAADPPHKCSTRITPFARRVEMLRLVLGGDRDPKAKLELCLIEGRLPTPSYTVDTLRWLQSESGKEVDFYFLIGMDAFAELLTWKSYRELLCRVTLLVAPRQGFSPTDKLEQISRCLGYDRGANRWHAAEAFHDIVFLHSMVPEVSSSAIRQALARGKGEVAGLDSRVLDYIRSHGLYREA